MTQNQPNPYQQNGAPAPNPYAAPVQQAQPYAAPAQAYAPAAPAWQPGAVQPQPHAQPAQPAQLYAKPAQPAQPYAQPAQPAQPYAQPAQPYTQPAVPYGAAPGQPAGYYPNGYPIYPGNPYYYNPQLAQQAYEKRLRVEKAKKSLRYLGNMSGLGVILFLAFNTVMSLILTIPGVYNLYTANAVFSGAFSIISSFIYMFIPFLIIAFLIRSKDKTVNFVPFKKMNTKRALLSIPIGLTICIGANIIVNIIITLFEQFGFKLSQQSDALAEPTTAFGLVITLVSTAVMPALLEEFAIRGVILQPARKYGMAFAIISSSVIFGLMHGNFIQAPFAFIVGACFAFFAIKCDSLWIVRRGTCQNFMGDLDDYKAQLLKNNDRNDLASDKMTSKEMARKEAAARRARVAPLKKEIRALDEKLAKLTARKQMLEEQLLKVYSADSSIELALLNAQIKDVEEEWLRLNEECEQALKS